jgi:predicted metal-binding protein
MWKNPAKNQLLENTMDEKIIISLNDTHRALGRLIDNINGWAVGSELCDQRVAAIVKTKLEEAQLWSLKMVKGSTKPLMLTTCEGPDCEECNHQNHLCAKPE